jgi:hypothetical protein
MRRIGVIGGEDPAPKILELAREVGKIIAKRGHLLVCGGLGGVMEAACAGAKEEGGKTVGILPGVTCSDANCWIDIPIVTGMGYARNVIVVLTSEVLIAVGGRYGTLSEIAYAFQFGIPVIGLSTWRIEGVSIRHTNSPDEAVSLAESAIQ